MREIARQFSVVEFPDLQSDWTILRKVSDAAAARVRDQIGGRVRLDRESLVNDVRSRLESGRMLVALGPSGSGKSVIAKNLAQRDPRDHLLWLNDGEAARLSRGTPISELSVEECAVVDELVEERICSTSDERVFFEHDLFADWARQRRIVSEASNISAFIRQQAHNPRWHRAIRLVGLQELEQAKRGSGKWKALVSQLSNDGKEATQESDLVLEAIFFSADADSLLEAAWEDLKESEGVLITRLLHRFLHVATLPHPGLTSDPDENGDYSIAAAAMWRLPYWPLWLPMLEFLHCHRLELLGVCTELLTRIANLWLRTSPADWPKRDEAAEIVLAAAERM